MNVKGLVDSPQPVVIVTAAVTVEPICLDPEGSPRQITPFDNTTVALYKKGQSR